MTPRQLLGVLLGAGLVAAMAAFATVEYFFPDKQATPGQQAARPNVVLISVDTLRPDHLSLYGYPRKTSPFIDEFFRDGEIWENVYAAEASTAPSIASILTGRMPQRHGVRLFYQRLGAEIPTLADLLGEHGYETAAIVSNVVLTAEAMGLDERFDHYDDFVDEREGARPIWERRASRTTDAALAWLSDHADSVRPLFLWVHYIDPHGPYHAPEDKPVEYNHEGRREIDPSRIPRYTRLADDPGDALLYIDRYDEEIAYTDREIGRLLDAWAEASLVTNTIFVLTSDHGESMTDAYRYFSHGFDIVESVMRVPLAVRRPGGSAARLTSPVSSMDIMPSILSWLALPIPAELEGFPLGERPAEAPVPLEATNWLGQARAAIVGNEKWVVRRNGKGVVRHRSLNELPSLAPTTKSLPTKEPGTEDWPENTATRALARWIEEDDYPALMDRRKNPGRKIHAPKVAPGRSEREIEGLRALGYVE
jgi:arylsulfatase A-like enzyme